MSKGGTYEIDDNGFGGQHYRYKVVRVHEDGLREVLVSDLSRMAAEIYLRDLEENFG